MDPFDFGLLTPPPFISLEPDDFFQTDNLGTQDMEQFEKKLEQAKKRTLLLKAQDQQRETSSSLKSKPQVSESRYWTNEERQRFKKALKTFGTDFAAISKFVGTRSSTQVRTHAQKYYAKLIRDYKRSGKAHQTTAGKEQKETATNSIMV